MAENSRKIASPSVGPETEKFWAALMDGILLLKRCRRCDEVHYFPRGRCPFCLSDETVWEESSGKGVVYSVSIMRRGAGAPYALAYVTLDEGVSMLTNIVDYGSNEPAIGQPVRLAPIASENGQLVPAFTPG
ncbi:MAG: OB-fold domain-containing protein [Sphingomonas sp.]|uniref:Zn-ribbon domain-containing OB-fold protein n=1 Tax=Sphingomonas sp. TaxID=28214 RepID=UPI001AD0C88B|nr:OB-fold domain-containing protein [Sphingomonas sp.]MBN8814354.1 OB-fold domain-containing protein [Sphingomonas sp.]